MKHNLKDLSLKQLQHQRNAWLEEYKDMLKVLTLAALGMGEPERMACRDYRIVTVRSIQFIARDATETFDPFAGCPKQAYSLSVMINQYQVVSYHWYADPKYPDLWADNNFIVPGDWLREAVNLMERYKNIAASQQSDAEHIATQALRTKLLDGINI